MTMDLDAALRRLAAAPPHPGLAGIESAVFRRLAEQRRDDARSRVRLGVVAAVGAVLMGVAGAGVTGVTSAAQTQTLSPFGPSTPLAPSTLLATSR